MNITEKIKKGKLIAVAICEAFILATLVVVIVNRDYSNIAVCLISFVVALMPLLIERIFSCEINSLLYFMTNIYTLGPLLGDCYKLYYQTVWWDKMLHTFAGVLFALFGMYIFEIMSEKQKNIKGGAMFAFCFSVTLAVLWEFFEFGCDSLLGTDMQRDTVIKTINSYLLGDGIGVVATIDGIESVVVDSVVLPTNGYIDIGLIDSMTDMLLETLGALCVAVFHLVDKGKHPLFVRTEKNDEEKELENENERS